MLGWVPFGDYQLSIDYKQAPHMVIFSHGFGVGRDARGMFSDIVQALPYNTGYILFDYNDIDETHNLIHTNGFDDQVRRLRAIIDWARRQTGVASISLVGHSLGGLVIADLAPADIEHIILLAPPLRMQRDGRRERYTAVPGAQLLRNVWRIPKRDGRTLLIPETVFDELVHVDAEGELVKLSLLHEYHLIIAEADDFLPDEDYTGLIVMDTISSIGIEGADHNFSGVHRQQLVDTILTIVAPKVPAVNDLLD